MKICGFVLLAFLGNVYGKACEEGYFECDNGNCVYESWLCDGDNDCGDGSDERPENCLPCSDSQFTCANGKCIPVQYICDRDDDCGDMSDEIDPATGKCPVCPDYAFTCPNTGNCIPRSVTCNGFNNCGDWSDEAEEACPCSDEEIRCSRVPGSDTPGKCVPTEWICDEDGIWDCPNGDDEQNCSRPAGFHKPSYKTLRKAQPIPPKMMKKSMKSRWFNVKKQ